jgi:PAS domain S-box-containing protein
MPVPSKPQDPHAAEIAALRERLDAQTRIASYHLERYEFVAGALPLQYWTARATGELDFVNPRVTEYFGRTAAQMIGEGWKDHVHPDDLPTCGARWGHALATGEPYECEFRLKRADGSYRWHIARARPQRARDGRIERWYGTNTDVAELKAMMARLQGSEARYRLVSEASHGGLWFWDLETDHVEWTDQLLAMLGVPREDWGGRLQDFRERVHPDDRERLQVAMRGHLERGLPFEVEFRLRHQGGEYRLCSTRGLAERDEAGKPRLMAGGVSDITSRLRAETALHFLLTASKLLERPEHAEEAIRAVAELAVPTLGDWCAIEVRGADGGLQRLAMAHTDPDKVALAEELARRFPTPDDAPQGAPRVARSGESELIPEITDALLEAVVPNPEQLALLRGLGLRSSMCAPVTDGGKAIGAITMVTAESTRLYGPLDLQLLEALGARIGAAWSRPARR